MYGKSLSPSLRERLCKISQTPGLWARRTGHVDVGFGFLRFGRWRRIYNRRVTFLFFRFLRRGVGYGRFFLLAGSEQREAG